VDALDIVIAAHLVLLAGVAISTVRGLRAVKELEDTIEKMGTPEEGGERRSL